jgi:hypothetical protein
VQYRAIKELRALAESTKKLDKYPDIVHRLAELITWVAMGHNGFDRRHRPSSIGRRRGTHRQREEKRP